MPPTLNFPKFYVFIFGLREGLEIKDQASGMRSDQVRARDDLKIAGSWKILLKVMLYVSEEHTACV